MNIEEIKTTLNYLLDNNLDLVEQGLDKIAVNLEGKAGIAKSSILREIAQDRGAKYVKIELASLEELGDLIGVPQKTYVMRNADGDEINATEKLIPQYTNLGYKLCPDCEPKMTYAIPYWVPENDEEEVILNLDDWTRTNSLFMNAIMSLLQWGEYLSWKLPKKCHLVMTSNPLDGNYSTNIDFDSAQSSRFITLNVDFDVQCWAKWADRTGIRSEFKHKI